MADVPKIVRQRLQVTAKAGVHPEPDLLAAFAEKALGGRERMQVLEHLAQCADCREVVSLATPELEPASAVSAGPARAPWLPWPVLRWGALAACVVVVGAAVTLRYQKRESAAQFTAANQPAPAAVAEKSAAKAQASQTADDKVVANVESRKLTQPRRDIADASSTRAKQLGRSDSALVNKKSLAALSEMDQLTTGAKAALAPKIAEAAPAPPPFSKTADAEQKKDGRQENPRGSVGKLAAGVGSVTEMVEVAPATPEGDEAARGKAKEGKNSLSRTPSKAQSVEVIGMASAVTTSEVGGSTTLPTQGRNSVQLQNLAELAPRWTLSSTGALQRSLDAGKTWETIPVGSTAVFRALSVLDSEIWVGGSGGVLYHSSDNGQHWVQVKPSVGDKSLTADIIGVEFTDARHGKLTTASGETWITGDAGQSWQKK
jgi:hypothetical protein